MTNQEIRGAIIGMVLGDAYLSKEGRLSMRHCENQKDYMLFKRNILQKKQKQIIPIYSVIQNGYKGIGFATRRRPIYRILRKKMYKNGVKTISMSILKWLTPLGIAIWFMDDGSTSYKFSNAYSDKNGRKIKAVETTINTYLSKEQNEIIINYFKERWGIKMGLNKSRGKYRIRMGTKEARKFVKIIEPYIVPSMKYKIEKLLI